ncbi:MAG: DUF349 domain-containing protein [Bacteroidota bacterium]
MNDELTPQEGASSEESMGIGENAENQTIGASDLESVSDTITEEVAPEPEPLPATEEQFMETAAPEAAMQQSEDLEPEEDLSTLSKEQLVERLEQYASEQESPRFKDRVNSIRDNLSQTFSQEREAALAKFIEDGGNRDDFKPVSDPLEERFSKALKKFNKRRFEYQEQQEKQRKVSLDEKREILGQLKDLIQNEENMNKAFERFHELQARWRAAGPVPSADAKDLQMSYKFLIDKFYDYIKINRELQDLDQRRNLEMKLRLCEQAEELILDSSISNAFKKLHMLQDKWRETGPVPRDKKDEVWDRFKAACDKVFERRREYEQQFEEKRKVNLDAKTALCEQVEALKSDADAKHKEWQEITAKLLELQAAWRKIGHAGKQHNDGIWTRFRSACDNLFKSKNDFYSRRKHEYAANLQLKTELCIQAEALQENTDWKSTSEELKRLQEEWKKIGFAGDRQSEKIWKRFRSACDAFFAKKSEHFSSRDKDNEENLVKKNELIARIDAYVPGEDHHASFEELKAFQREWNAVGLVPIKKKDEVNARFKQVIDAQFAKLKSSDRPRGTYQPKTQYVSKAVSDKGGDPERRSLLNRISELKNDVQIWENNIGFFAKSKTADKLKSEFEDKISKAKKEIGALMEKLKGPELPKPSEEPPATEQA